MRKNHVRIAVPLVLIALAVTACGGSSSSSPPTTIPALRDPGCAADVPAGAKVTLSTDLPATDPRIVTIQCAMNVVARNLGSRSVDARIAAGSNVDALAALMVANDPTLKPSSVVDNMSKSESLVYSNPYQVAMNLTKIGVDESAAPSPDWLLSTIVAHDSFHTVEWTLLGGGAHASGKKMDAEPAWLIEATPAWFADHLLESNGYSTENATAKAAVSERAANFPGLAKWETWDGFGSWNAPATKLPTALRFEAFPAIAQMLVDRAGADALLYDYWTARASTTEPWQTTFKSVFGVSVDDFYAQVAKYFADLAKTAPSTTAAN